jgi:hypothetical protein
MRNMKTSTNHANTSGRRSASSFIKTFPFGSF